MTVEEIAAALSDSGTARVLKSSGVAPATASPGHAERHYSPKARTLAVAPNLLEMLDADTEKTLARNKVLYAGYEGSKPHLPAGWTFASFGSRGDLDGVGHDLYDVLRSIDTDEVDLIVVELTGTDRLGRAIDDRLTRAASSLVITDPKDLVAAIL